jgi:organic radical activating enzyme
MKEIINSADALRQGLELPLMEEFYSIQGEGFNTGKAAYFARIGGCDVGCKWCDSKESWNASKWPATPTDHILENILQCPAKAVVVTGGEPLMYNLDYFCKQLKENKIETFLETSGAYPHSGNWDWICLSPKQNQPPLQDMLSRAHELKVIIESEKDFEWAEKNAKLVNETCYLYLQPEWSKRDQMMPQIVEYILDHPQWRISIQSHKYMRIP